MNTTIAKVIAFELGILIAILTWMTFSGSSFKQRKPVAEPQEQAADSFATVSPVYQPARPAVNYLADEDAQEANDVQPIQTVQRDDSQIMGQLYRDSGYPGYPVVADPSTYIGTFPEPVLGPGYYGYPVDSYLACPGPTQIIVISSPRSFDRRNGIAPRMISPRMRVSQPRLRQPAPRTGRMIQPRTMGPRMASPPSRPIAKARPSGSGSGLRTNFVR